MKWITLNKSRPTFYADGYSKSKASKEGGYAYVCIHGRNYRLARPSRLPKSFSFTLLPIEEDKPFTIDNVRIEPAYVLDYAEQLFNALFEACLFERMVDLYDDVGAATRALVPFACDADRRRMWDAQKEWRELRDSQWWSQTDLGDRIKRLEEAQRWRNTSNAFSAFKPVPFPNDVKIVGSDRESVALRKKFELSFKAEEAKQVKDLIWVPMWVAFGTNNGKYLNPEDIADFEYLLTGKSGDD
jgi:hypothetical protein